MSPGVGLPDATHGMMGNNKSHGPNTKTPVFTTMFVGNAWGETVWSIQPTHSKNAGKTLARSDAHHVVYKVLSNLGWYGKA